MHLSRLEFTGHGDMSTGNLKNGAGETMMEMFQYCGAADEIYDRFCNPKIKVSNKINAFDITQALKPRKLDKSINIHSRLSFLVNRLEQNGLQRHKMSTPLKLVSIPSSKTSLDVFSGISWTCVTTP